MPGGSWGPLPFSTHPVAHAVQQFRSFTNPEYAELLNIRSGYFNPPTFF